MRTAGFQTFRSPQPARLTGWLRCAAALLAGLGCLAADPAPGLDADRRAALEGIARDRFAIRWTDLGTNDLAVMHRRAEAIGEALREHHLPHGLVVSLRHEGPARAEVRALGELERSAAWSGFYLAATAYRFSVTRDPAALADVRRVLEGVERLTSVPDLPGRVAAYAGPGSDPAYRAVYARHGGEDPGRPGLGRLAVRGPADASDTVWLLGNGPQNLEGLNFGLAMAYWRIREPGIRSRISNIVTGVAGRLEADAWRVRDGRSPDAYVGPLASAAVLRTAATIDFQRFNPAYELHARRIQELDPPVAPPYGDLHSTAFAVGNLLALSGLETNTTRKLIYQHHLKELWRGSGAQLNPWYAAAYVNCFDEPPRDMVARATLQGVLFQFPDPPRLAPWRDRGAEGGVALREANGERWLQYPALLPDRPVMPFQWAWSACLAAGGEQDTVVHPGLDYLLPFWMGRDAGLIPSADAAPVPTDLRDRFRRTPPTGTNAPAGRPRR